MPQVATDPFRGYPDDPRKQGRRVYDVTPSDANELPVVSKCLFILTNGDIYVEPADGYYDNAIPPVKKAGGVKRTVVAGQIFDEFQVRQVYSTGTTATMQATC